MKREARNHSKMRRLCRKLDVPLYQAMGILECLWHLTAVEAWRGDIGKLSNEDIALALDYRGDEDQLIEALIASGWIDKDETYRLLVHDWAEHADNTVQKRAKRSIESGQTGFYSPLSGHVQTFPSVSSLPEPEPGSLPEPEPEPEPGSGKPNGHFLLPAAGASERKDEAIMIARAVQEDIKISGTTIFETLRSQALFELDDGATRDGVRDRMSWAWTEFQECVVQQKIKFDGGADWFFKNGKWKSAKLWGLKKGATAKVQHGPGVNGKGAGNGTHV